MSALRRHARHSRSKNGVASLAYGRASSIPEPQRFNLRRSGMLGPRLRGDDVRRCGFALPRPPRPYALPAQGNTRVLRLVFLSLMLAGSLMLIASMALLILT